MKKSFLPLVAAPWFVTAALAQGPDHTIVAPVTTPSAATNSAATTDPVVSTSDAATSGSTTPAADAAAANDNQVARAEPAGEREITTRLQIFLDQQNFGPGKIDGRPGEFTLKALGRYQLAHGLTVTSKLADACQLPLDSVYPIYTTYTIKDEDLKHVGNAPHKPAEQAKQKSMPYESLLEFLEERYHSDPEFLRKLNKELDCDKLKPGDVVRVPNVAPFKIEDVHEVGRITPVPEYKKRRIHVDTKQKMLDLYEGEKLLAAFPITPGSEKLPAPPGTWHILGIATLPWFRHDEGVLNYGVRTDHFYNIPAGPNNPVGVVWIGLSKPGIGIHGTNTPETIGRSGSHGCIRLANWDAIRLITMVTEDMKVVIDDGIPRPKAVLASAQGKISSKTPLTGAQVSANKTTPPNSGSDTQYANH